MKGAVDEADVPAEPDSPQAGTWLPRPDEDASRADDPEAPSGEGAQAAGCHHTHEVGVGDETGPFRRADRLLRSGEFQHVTRHGRRTVVNAFVVLVAVRGEGSAASGSGPEGSGPRLGVTVSRRVGSAVVRNRVKRRIREWFRQDRGRLKHELDLVVIARQAAAGMSGREVAERLAEAMDRAGAVAT
jgi:ribonuclease P protein component